MYVYLRKHKKKWDFIYACNGRRTWILRCKSRCRYVCSLHSDSEFSCLNFEIHSLTLITYMYRFTWASISVYETIDDI